MWSLILPEVVSCTVSEILPSTYPKSVYLATPLAFGSTPSRLYTTLLLQFMHSCELYSLTDLLRKLHIYTVHACCGATYRSTSVRSSKCNIRLFLFVLNCCLCVPKIIRFGQSIWTIQAKMCVEPLASFFGPRGRLHLTPSIWSNCQLWSEHYICTCKLFIYSWKLTARCRSTYTVS